MNQPGKQLLSKYSELKQYLASLEKAAVAFSGGVDSTFLLYAAKEALGENVLAVTSSSPFFPARELEATRAFCREQGIRHRIVENPEVLENEEIARNPVNRCYLCKHEIFENLLDLCRQEGIGEIVEGSNLDDEGDYRPGMKAIQELGIRSPLRQTGFTKEEIRILARYLGLPVWNKPSSACLASRIPYGDEISEEKLRMSDQAEQLLLDLGFRQLRVRGHGTIARIELEPSAFTTILKEDIREKVYQAFRDIGFSYVTLDLLGYRTGSLNESLSTTEQTIE